MVIACPSSFVQRRISWFINFGILVFGFLLFIYTLLPVSADDEMIFSGDKKTARFSHALIGGGPMALNGLRSYIPVPSLKTELMLLGKNTRPDVIHKTVLLGLKSASEEKVALDGETVYLKQTAEDQFSFSVEKTPLSLRPIVMEDGVLLEIAKDDLQGSMFVKDFPTLPLEEPAYAATLKRAFAWGHDILLQNYGGEEYFSFRDKMRLEFGEGPSSYVFFVEPGDLLIWAEERWQPVSLENFSPHLPLACITAVSGREIDLQAWDETGFYPMNFKIAIKTPTRLPAKLDEIFTALRPRTSTEVTCLLGKKRVVLKEGDWWLKTETGWHNLKSLHEIEDLLQHKTKGELVIFDSMENEKGKTILKGHIFDPMRTHMQPIALAAGSDKKSTLAARKKNNIPAIARNREMEAKPTP